MSGTSSLSSLLTHYYPVWVFTPCWKEGVPATASVILPGHGAEVSKRWEAGNRVAHGARKRKEGWLSNI
jgi:hypothetical protein